jgi:hypothetical protein
MENDRSNGDGGDELDEFVVTSHSHFDNDLADYTKSTTTAAASSPFFSKKWKVFWMIVVIARVISVLVTSITSKYPPSAPSNAVK